MPKDVSVSDSKCCENATVGKNGLRKPEKKKEVQQKFRNILILVSIILI